MQIRSKRIYEAPCGDDGLRVLVERLWPRGVSREAAHIDLWDKDIAPSTDLRRWWHHDEAAYDEFARRYSEELDASGAARDLLARADGHGRLTLLHAARDPLNSASVLASYLERLINPGSPT